MLRLTTLILLGAMVAGCSVKRLAVDTIGDALSGSGGVYTSDEDPDLVREAIPFGLKTFESLLEVSPEHEGLLLATATGFAGYAYLLKEEADLMPPAEYAQARAQRKRASRLFLRGRDFALRGLDVAHPGLSAALKQDGADALDVANEDDIPFLYWAGAAWAGALAADTENLDLVAELPLAAALVRRVLELDESYDKGAAHEFFIAYEGGRPGGNLEAARRHYQRALELSGGERASTHLALAETVTVPQQNYAEFRALLAAARAVPPDRVPSLRLVNTLAQRRACWLESRIPELFVDIDTVEEPSCAELRIS